MNILFVNDDGYDSEGLHSVAALFKEKHNVAVVAPDEQKSGYSHSITLKPAKMPYREVSGYDYPVFAITGTPVDCVKVGLTTLFRGADLVISGINCGENLGSDIMYSGTVAAAIDAAHMGVRAIALSLDKERDQITRADYDACAKFVFDNLERLISRKLGRTTILNINFPGVEPKGIKVTRMNTQETFVDVYKSEGDALFPCGHRNYEGLTTDNDEYYCKAGYITITPVRTDMTDYGVLDGLRGEFKL